MHQANVRAPQRTEEATTDASIVHDVVTGPLVTVSAISWERVWVSIMMSFESAPPADVEFMMYDTLRGYPLDAVRLSDTDYEIKINVTNFRDRHQIPNGSYRFMAIIDGARGPLAGFDVRRAEELHTAGRSFLYNQNRSTYVVTFGLSQDDRADTIMRVYQLNRPAPKASKSKGA